MALFAAKHRGYILFSVNIVLRRGGIPVIKWLVAVHIDSVDNMPIENSQLITLLHFVTLFVAGLPVVQGLIEALY